MLREILSLTCTVLTGLDINYNSKNHQQLGVPTILVKYLNVFLFDKCIHLVIRSLITCLLILNFCLVSLPRDGNMSLLGLFTTVTPLYGHVGTD